MAMDLQIDGGEQLAKMLKAFPDRIHRDIINSGAAQGATVVKKHARNNLKANDSVEYGRILKSIKSRKKRGVHGQQEVFTDKTAPHAHLVEFGTGPRKLKKPISVELMPGQWRVITQTGSAPAKPFFRPALDENKEEVMAEMTKRVGKRMDKEAEKMNQQFGALSKSYRKKLAK